jgi:putative ABC transport system permease protein
MFRNYLKIALRHLGKKKLYSLINISGLAVALTCMVFSILYYKNNSHLFRINTSYADNVTELRETTGGTGQVQGPAFKTRSRKYRIMGG